MNSVIESSTELDIGSIFVVNSCHKELVSCLINSNKIQMQIDTGADVSIISSKLWKDLGEPKLKHHNMKLTAYDGHIMKCLGYFTAEVETEKRIHAIKLTVIESEKSYGLLGQDIIEDTKTINSATAKNKSSDFLPVIRGVQAKMELLKDANNFFCRARPVPLALESKVNAELLRLEEMGIIFPCRDPVANCSPVVWIKKDNGELRMCVDFKVHVNRKIKTETYPLPNIETIFARMKNAKRFAKIDLKSAYWQIELDNNARQLSIINTSKGLFYVNRLQMGMKNSSSISQRTMEDILADIKGILIYQDDILVFGENDEALKKRLEAVKQRLNEKKITINKEKSIEYVDEITFLGFSISSRGIQPDQKLVNKIQDISVPSNKKEVESFIGLVNYFGRLIPQFSNKILPINNLRKKETQFIWSNECQESFDKLKTELSSHPIVRSYCLKKEATLTTDASKEAIGAVLTQEGHPVIFVSRTLSEAEKNYSNIEREALAIVWSVSRFTFY